MSIYESLKKGHKVSIAKEINELSRNLAMRRNFDLNKYDLKQIFDKILNNYFVKKAIENSQNEDEIYEFKRTLFEKIKNSLDNFSKQTPTAKQIYYYISLCLEAGEKHEMIMSNFYITKEIGRLKDLINSNENENKF